MLNKAKKETFFRYLSGSKFGATKCKMIKLSLPLIENIEEFDSILKFDNYIEIIKNLHSLKNITEWSQKWKKEQTLLSKNCQSTSIMNFQERSLNDSSF